MKRIGRYLCAALIALLLVPAICHADPNMIFNEWNAVASDRYLAGGSYKVDPTKQDPYWATIPGMPDGRLEGNGGNWIELAVVKDGLNIQGWQLRWAETDDDAGQADDADGTDLWYGDGDIEQGIITFSATAPIWANLRKGTIITISEKHHLYVDTDWDGGLDDRNFTDGLDAGDPEVDVTIHLTTNITYNPMPADPNHPDADWWIHLSSREEQGKGAAALVTTVTNVDGDDPGDFSVGPYDWELSIYNDEGGWEYGPIGEGITDFGNFPGGIDDEEAGRLEADPNDPGVDNDDYDNVTSTTFGAPNEWGGQYQDFYGLRVPEPASLLLLAAGLPLALKRRRDR